MRAKMHCTALTGGNVGLGCNKTKHSNYGVSNRKIDGQPVVFFQFFSFQLGHSIHYNHLSFRTIIKVKVVNFG